MRIVTRLVGMALWLAVESEIDRGGARHAVMKKRLACVIAGAGIERFVANRLIGCCEPDG